ncbi:hypothetical protein [Rhodococcus sp. PSBB049]|uniref:hypothetical protein n=1 Tax=Rhodococcus sp. PSBB049 TaxID=2812863 RepID=UPI001F11ADC3|nr:hypothetical protein [Rhodococcus sp. PSBB049]
MGSSVPAAGDLGVDLLEEAVFGAQSFTESGDAADRLGIEDAGPFVAGSCGPVEL